MRNKLVIIVFSGFLLVFGLGYIFNPQREFSEMENHYLSIRPDFTWKNYLKGEFTADFDSYTADQILGKDLLVETNVAANYAVGISRVNQVYIGKDQYLIQDYQKPDDQLNANLNYIRGFAAEHPEADMSLLIVPNVNEIYPEKLPQFAETYSQATVISQIQSTLEPDVTVIDASDTSGSRKGMLSGHRSPAAGRQECFPAAVRQLPAASALPRHAPCHWLR